MLGLQVGTTNHVYVELGIKPRTPCLLSTLPTIKHVTSRGLAGVMFNLQVNFPVLWRRGISGDVCEDRISHFPIPPCIPHNDGLYPLNCEAKQTCKLFLVRC